VKPRRWNTAVLCLSLVAGCSTMPSSVRTPPPASLVAPCPPIQKAEATELGALFQFAIDLVGQYADCAARQRKLAEWAKGAP
jgi:hypothetical protein